MEFKMDIFVFILLIVAVWSGPGDSRNRSTSSITQIDPEEMLNRSSTSSIKPIDEEHIVLKMDQIHSFDRNAKRYQPKRKSIDSKSKKINYTKNMRNQIKDIASDMAIKVYELTANNTNTMIINPENDIALIINNRLKHNVGLSSVIIQGQSKRYINQYKRTRDALNAYTPSQENMQF
jgi:hypothetical protein